MLRPSVVPDVINSTGSKQLPWPWTDFLQMPPFADEASGLDTLHTQCIHTPRQERNGLGVVTVQGWRTNQV